MYQIIRTIYSFILPITPLFNSKLILIILHFHYMHPNFLNIFILLKYSPLSIYPINKLKINLIKINLIKTKLIKSIIKNKMTNIL